MPRACVRFCSVSPGTPSPAVPDEGVAAAILPERTWSALLVDHLLGTQACKQLTRAADAPVTAHRAVNARRACRAKRSGLHPISDQAGARWFARRAPVDERRLRSVLTERSGR